MSPAGKVLMMLADPAEARVLADRLSAEGIESVTAGDGITGLALVSDAKPDLVLCSRRLPKLDGLQACRLIKRNHKLKHVAVLVVLEAGEDAPAAGPGSETLANDYLQRPITLPGMLAAIRGQLAQRTSLTRLRDDNKELAALLETSELLTSTLSSADLFYIIVHALAEAVSVQACALLRVDPQGFGATIEASLDPEDADRRQVPLAELPEVRRALSTNRMVYVEDARRDAEIAAATKTAEATSLLAVPLASRQPAEGRVVLRLARVGETFTYREIKFCQIVTTVAANALDNARLYESLEVAHSSLTELSRKDPLTDTFNRRYLFERLESEFARSLRHEAPLSCLMIDLDHFKRVNDELGHQTGDAVLAGVAQVLKGCLRGQDLLGRYGGEEFLAVLPDTDEAGAAMAAARIQRGVRSARFEGAGDRQVTLSIGIAARTPGVTGAEALVALADGALYEAKASGRDRAVAAGAALAVAAGAALALEAK